ncbi:MAG: hypothetical protein IPP83_07750 [Flavobacteriales bacterium]|nr:hypothetical protein [Flavobacteriales bacterium]
MNTYLNLVSLLLLCGTAVHGQVNVDVPVRFIGPDDTRVLDGLADPVSGDAAITVEGSLRSQWAWAGATVQDTTITLAVTPPVSAYTDGLLVRFIAPVNLAGKFTLRLEGLQPLPLVRTDGIPIALGQLGQGRVAEVMLAGGNFVLLGALESGCPQGFLSVNTNYCIETAPPFPANTWHWAVDHCADLGGRLCTWGEYAAACTILTGQLNGMFVNWEWIDDTSNHTHGADQAGRTTCNSQRTTLASQPGRARCCYHLR